MISNALDITIKFIPVHILKKYLNELHLFFRFHFHLITRGNLNLPLYSNTKCMLLSKFADEKSDLE